MFADDCIVYKVINSESDQQALQYDLDLIATWCEKWKMSLNEQKSVHVTFTGKRSYDSNRNTINNATLEQVSEYKYLGVFFSADLRWNRHVTHVRNKAVGALGFLKRIFSSLPQKLREQLYFTHVRSTLEYACVCWDPYTTELVDKREKVQNRAVRFVLGNYDRMLSMTESKKALNWHLLEHRRRNLRLKFLHNIYHSNTGIAR